MNALSCRCASILVSESCGFGCSDQAGCIHRLQCNEGHSAQADSARPGRELQRVHRKAGFRQAGQAAGCAAESGVVASARFDLACKPRSPALLTCVLGRTAFLIVLDGVLI